MVASNQDDDAKRDRSPTFPFIGVDTALDRARVFYEQYGKNPARVDNVGTVWKLAKGSSGLLRTVSALKAYGLINDEGSGSSRKVTISESAIRALKDQRPGERERAIQQAVHRPKLLAEFIGRWGARRPPDHECISDLHIDRGFTEKGAQLFLKVYDEAAKHVSSVDESEDDDIADTGTSTDGDALVEERPPLQAPPSRQPRATGAGMMQDVFSIPEGSVVIQWPTSLSQESLQDVKDWLQIVTRKISRSLKQASNDGTAEE